MNSSDDSALSWLVWLLHDMAERPDTTTNEFNGHDLDSLLHFVPALLLPHPPQVLTVAQKRLANLQKALETIQANKENKEKAGDFSARMRAAQAKKRQSAPLEQPPPMPAAELPPAPQSKRPKRTRRPSLALAP